VDGTDDWELKTAPLAAIPEPALNTQGESPGPAACAAALGAAAMPLGSVTTGISKLGLNTFTA